MTPVHRLFLASWITALLLVSGCSSAAEKVERSARTARSWVATVRKTSDALAGGAVPRVYARQVLDAAIETRRELTRRPEWPSLSQSTRGQLDVAIRDLASALGEPADTLPAP